MSRKKLQILSLPLLMAPSLATALDTNPPNITNEVVDPSLLDIVDKELPESVVVDPGFLNTDYDPYLTLNQDANVSLTFLDEGAGYKNSLGWLSFGENSFSGLSKGSIDTDGSGVISLSELGAVDGVSYGWLFPNVSTDTSNGNNGSRGNGNGNGNGQGKKDLLMPGDTVAVGGGTLSAGTSISFFLGQNSWTSGDEVSDDLLTGDKQLFYGLDFLNPEADTNSTFDSNLSGSRHVAMLFADESREEVIMGFEDLNRDDPSSNDWNIRSDNDFNDAVFIITSDPVDAFGDSNIATGPAPLLGAGGFGMALLCGLSWLARRPERDEKA